MRTEDLSIDTIVERVVGELTSASGKAASQAPPAFDGRGILEDVDSAVGAASRASVAFGEVPLALRRAIVGSMRAAALANAERLSRMAVAETGLGRVEDKIRKNSLVAESTP